MQFYQIASDVLNCPFHPVAAGSTHDAALLFKTFLLVHLQYTFSFNIPVSTFTVHVLIHLFSAFGTVHSILKKMLPIYLPTEHDELSCLNQLTYPVLSIIYFPSQKSSENEFSLIFFSLSARLFLEEYCTSSKKKYSWNGMG